MREKLIDRMIHIYGFEHPITIKFCRLCETWENNKWNDTALETIVKVHEAAPVLD